MNVLLCNLAIIILDGVNYVLYCTNLKPCFSCVKILIQILTNDYRVKYGLIYMVNDDYRKMKSK